jgi:hypothetical protein
VVDVGEVGRMDPHPLLPHRHHFDALANLLLG